MPLKDPTQELRTLLDELLAVKGVLGAGVCFLDRGCESRWNSSEPSGEEAFWTGLGDTFRLLKLHKLPSLVCEWHWSLHSVLAVEREFGVIGVVVRRASYAEVAPQVQSLLGCESSVLGLEALEVRHE